ncbi:lysoplasmalogenase [Photobacterium nomapromontoriensis]|uniref:lysoplasmalogenase n=1 Tax=Photobacterium nomapromontoriensis TaxID=2910237 RepID=UPI003D0C2C22
MWIWLAIALSGLAHITAYYYGPKWQFYVFKPFTLSLLIIAAWQAPASSFYHVAIMVGMLLSLIGDIFLMLPRDRFIAGLSCFLLAHIAYSIAFWSQLAGSIVWWLPAMLVAAGVITFLFLLPSLGSLVLPVACYIAVIVQMSWAAGAYWLTAANMPALLAFAGSLIFMFSDLCLAVDRFRGPFRPATAWVMTSYFLAQSLIVATLWV